MDALKRTVLFRGKRVDNGEWVCGYPFPGIGQFDSEKWFVTEIQGRGNASCSNTYRVDPSTVCQFTGLTDRNGVKIFEGDVVRMHYFFENYHLVTLGAFEDESEIICKLSITPLGVYFESANMTGYLFDYLEDPEEELEVIGNAHDNPELLEENNT